MLTTVINELSGIGSFLLPVISGVYGYLSEKHSFLYITLGLSVFASLITILVYKHSSRLSEYFYKKICNVTCPASDYRVIKKTIVYEYKSRDEILFKKTFDFKVLRNGVHGVQDKFSWTGNEELKPEATKKGTKINMLDNRYGMQRYEIILRDQKNLSKGEIKKNYGMVVRSIDDSEHKSSSHLSSGIYEITDEIILKVVFPRDLKIHSPRFLEYLHYTDDNYYKSYEAKVHVNEGSNKKELVFSVKNPYMGGRYVIDWSFSEEEGEMNMD